VNLPPICRYIPVIVQKRTRMESTNQQRESCLISTGPLKFIKLLHPSGKTTTALTALHRVSSPMISDEKTISFTDDGLYDVPHLEIKGAPLDTQPDVETDYSDVDFPTDCGNNTPRPSGLTHPNDSFSLQESKRRKVEQFSESEMDSFLDSVRPNVRSRSPLDRSFKMLVSKSTDTLHSETQTLDSLEFFQNAKL
jgi:hypothetical protein